MIEIDVMALIYKDPRWIDFLSESVASAKNEITQPVLKFVANDPEDSVRSDPRIHAIVEHEDKNEYYLCRVYDAWNKAMLMAKTKYVVLINSDMYVSDFWLDQLWGGLEAGEIQFGKRGLPTSLLVESGRLDSAMPETVRDFGKSACDFDRDGFTNYANELRVIGSYTPGVLFMPVLFNRMEFLRAGGFPRGNVDGMSGDRYLFNRMMDKFVHLTCNGSVVYHVQEGEMRS